MATRKNKTLRPQLRTLFNLGAIRDRTDGQLLERFTTDSDELAELAFAALVERHGAMVMRVCLAQLANHHDALDAFQATFLVLVKKARSLWVVDSLGPWLHQVALRTAACARTEAARKRRLEHQAAERAADRRGQEEQPLDNELSQRLHEAIGRLPERYRIPIILCDLQGQTCEEAARQMGRPVGTVKCWRSRGRERLRRQLLRAGLAPTETLNATLAADAATGTGPTKPDAATARIATRIRTDPTTPGEVPASVWILVNGVMKTMLISKLRMASALVIALAFFGVGLGAGARGGADDPKKPGDESLKTANAQASPPNSKVPQLDSAAKKPDEKEIWNLTLRDAIRIGLENSETIRRIKPGEVGAPDDGFVIAPRDANQDVYRFQAETMALILSIARQYWSLVQQNEMLWSSERAVDLAEEIRKREESELEAGRGTTADVAEATQRAEQFQLDAKTRASDVATDEQQLRNLLGLLKVDSRRIVPSSQPTEERVSPKWNACLANMMEKQPDFARAISTIKNSHQAKDTTRFIDTFNSLLAALRDGRKQEASQQDITDRTQHLYSQQPLLQDIAHQTTHSLGRFFLEVDANYKQFKTASRLRTAAAHRLKVQRAFYEEGRITIDRYMDAVAQHASAIAQAVQFKTAYNISLLSLEEAQGTLLEREQITIAGGSPQLETIAAKGEGKTRFRSFESGSKPRDPVPAPQAPPVATNREDNPQSKDERRNANRDANRFSFQVTIPTSPKPVTIRGSFSIAPASAEEESDDQ